MDCPRDYRVDGFPEDVNLTRFYTDEYLESAELDETSCDYGEHWLPCRNQKQCLQKKHSMRKQCGTVFITTRIPLPQLRLVSRQVKLEHDERSHANSYISLYVEEDEDWRSMFSEVGKRIIAQPATTWSAKFAALHPFIRAQPTEVDTKILMRLCPESHILYDLEVVREIALWLPQKLTDISRVETFVMRLHFTGEAWEMFDDIVDWKDVMAYKSRIDAFMYSLECPTKPTQMSIV